MSITVQTPLPVDRAEEILPADALAFVEKLHQKFAATREDRLSARAVHREEVARSGKLDFLPETACTRVQGGLRLCTRRAAQPDRPPALRGERQIFHEFLRPGERASGRDLPALGVHRLSHAARL